MGVREGVVAMLWGDGHGVLCGTACKWEGGHTHDNMGGHEAT